MAVSAEQQQVEGVLLSQMLTHWLCVTSLPPDSDDDDSAAVDDSNAARVSPADDGPYTKHTGGSRTPDGALAIRRQSIPGELPFCCSFCSSLWVLEKKDENEEGGGLKVTCSRQVLLDEDLLLNVLCL